MLRHHSLRTQLIFSFSIVIIIGVLLSTVVGVRLIGTTIIQQAQDKVRLDLNSAREIFGHESEDIKDIIRLTAERFFIKDAISQNDVSRLIVELQKIKSDESLDILTLTNRDGYVLVRANNPKAHGDQPHDEVLNWALTNENVAVSTHIVPEDELLKEGVAIAEQAKIILIPTPKAIPRTETLETSGMTIMAAAPIFDYRGDLIGILYGGKLINHNYEIVDKVKDIVYRSEQYKEKDIGTATIFQGDLRISTNVMGIDGKRAIGTRVSEEVYDKVIKQGVPWIDRAFVVNSWYITAYEPIRNIQGEIIGMLYVGMLEAPYIDLRNRVIFTFLGIALLTVILLSIIAYITTTRISKPIKGLLFATQKVAQGDLTHRVQVKSHDEIGQLGESFNQMTAALEKATEKYLNLTKTLEKKVEEKTDELRKTQDYLIQYEKLTSLGKLAAGIAHEINNPLTSILLNSHLMSEKLAKDDRFRESLQLIIEETTRCGNIVKGLLEFSRQTPPKKEMSDINNVIEKTLILFESQILVANVKIEKYLQKTLPMVMIDANKMKQVFTNIILNAVDAMPKGGILSIVSKGSDDNQFIEVTFKDTGCGIPQEDIGRIYDPFFSTKGTKGTGLGLSVSYGIIQQHNGIINISSEVGKGTLVVVRLPVKEKKMQI